MKTLFYVEGNAEVPLIQSRKVSQEDYDEMFDRDEQHKLAAGGAIDVVVEIGTGVMRTTFVWADALAYRTIEAHRVGAALAQPLGD